MLGGGGRKVSGTVWGMVGSGRGCSVASTRERVGCEIRELGWVRKGREGQAVDTGRVRHVAGWRGIWAQEKDWWGSPPAQAVCRSFQGPGKRTES